MARHRPYRAVNPQYNRAVVTCKRVIKLLPEIFPKPWEYGDGYELKPQDLPQTGEAKARLIAFYKKIERQQNNGSELEGARPFASKTRVHNLFC